jgi:hypothetical protein
MKFLIMQSINNNMLQLQVGGPRGTSSLQLSRLQARVAQKAQDYKGKGVLFQPHHPRTILRGSETQGHTATAAASAALSWLGLPSLEAQPTSTKSLQAPNGNSSSLNAMFTVVTIIFHQIMTEVSGADSEEDRIMATTRIVLKLMNRNGR